MSDLLQRDYSSRYVKTIATHEAMKIRGMDC